MPKPDPTGEILARTAALLQQERKRQGLSMNALAERAGLSQQMVSYVERGLRKPTLDTLLRMALALEIRLSGVIAAAERPGQSKRR